MSAGQPIKYVMYSHSHYDDITGGKLLKAPVIAHKNAQMQRLLGGEAACANPASFL